VDPTSDPQRDVASEVRAVFAAKCVGCHGPNLVKPRGRFGYVLDLARVASNREMVVPGSPAESELWELVKRGEMPPEDSPTGALTASQKEVIRSWIDAGAPSAFAKPETPAPSALPAEEVAAGPTNLSIGRHFLTWIGKFHLLILHFPIALLAAAAGRETWSMVRGVRIPAPEVRYCVLLGATSAVFTVALGWLHALGGHGADLPRVLTLHRWLGTAAGVWLVVTLVASEWDVRRGERSRLARLLLLGGALLVGLTAHFGGTLAQGEGFFAW
jgi:uncharacterized membrane protein